MPDQSSAVPDRLITERATAEILGISPDTLRRLSHRGEGPTRRKISPRRVGYKVSEVEAYRDGKSLGVSEHQPRERGRRLWRARK
jgi:predicted DNA-binding transcriptional regulator AlpA